MRSRPALSLSEADTNLGTVSRIFEHEFGKSVRYKSIRERVVGDAGAAVMDLKPVCS